MNTWGRRTVVFVLFAALVAALLWFQGIILRDEHPPAGVPAPPAPSSSAALARVERRTVPLTQVHPGFVEAIDPAAIAPRVMATVLEVGGREGDAVAAGSLVVALDDRDARAQLAQAEAALQAAEAQSVQATLAFERAQRLHDAEALTTQEWEAARAANDAAAAGAERARQAVEQAHAALSWFRLEAPFDGRVLERLADPGDLASPGRPVLTLYRDGALRFRVAVPEERSTGLSAGDELELAFDGLPTRRAAITRVLPSADPRTGTVVLHLALEDAAGLRPGLLGRLHLVVGEREALVVPEEAIERIGQVERVRLVRDGRVVPTTVRTGKRHAGDVEVLSGLSEGEEVVLR